MKRFILLLIPFLFNSCASLRKEKDQVFQKIGDLKNTALLVRLSSANNKIIHLTKQDRVNEIKEEELRIFQKNEKAIKAFQDYFDFCKVYFFEAKDGTKLKERKFDQIQLLDDTGVTVVDNSFLREGYLVGVFGYAYENQIVLEDEAGNKQVAAGTGGISSFVILDEEYVQIKKPFPFSVNYNRFVDNKDKAVQKMNKALTDFYLRYQRRGLSR